MISEFSEKGVDDMSLLMKEVSFEESAPPAGFARLLLLYLTLHRRIRQTLVTA